MVVEETGCCDRRAIDALAELPEHEREGWQELSLNLGDDD